MDGVPTAENGDRNDLGTENQTKEAVIHDPTEPKKEEANNDVTEQQINEVSKDVIEKKEEVNNDVTD